MGKPGFLIPPPGGRVQEGDALKQGDGETRFPHPPTRWEGSGGRRPPKNNRMFIAALCGGAAWTSDGY